MKKQFANMRLALKLATGFGLILMLTLGVAWTALSGVNLLKERTHVLSDQALVGSLHLADFGTNVARSRMLK